MTKVVEMITSDFYQFHFSESLWDTFYFAFSLFVGNSLELVLLIF